MTSYKLDSQKRALAKHREKIQRIEITVPAGRKEVYKDAAAAAGLSLNAFIVKCIEDAIERPETPLQDVTD